jgi:hypothetical protein
MQQLGSERADFRGILDSWIFLKSVAQNEGFFKIPQKKRSFTFQSVSLSAGWSFCLKVAPRWTLNSDLLQYCNVWCLILHFGPPTGTNTVPVLQHKFSSASHPVTESLHSNRPFSLVILNAAGRIWCPPAPICTTISAVPEISTSQQPAKQAQVSWCSAIQVWGFFCTAASAESDTYSTHPHVQASLNCLSVWLFL